MSHDTGDKRHTTLATRCTITLVSVIFYNTSLRVLTFSRRHAVAGAVAGGPVVVAAVFVAVVAGVVVAAGAAEARLFLPMVDQQRH